MEDLIKALQILLKYADKTDRCPTHCEHDVLGVYCVNPDDVSDEDKKTLDELGFFESDEYGENHFASFRFGSC